MNKNPHAGHRQRLRKRALTEGLANFNPHEVLETLLTMVIPRRDVNELAHEIADQFGGVEGALSASPEELMKIKGVGKRTCEAFYALSEAARYYAEFDTVRRREFSSPALVKPYLRAFFKVHDVYMIWQFNLDIRQNLICAEAICPADRLPDVCEILNSAMECGAKYVLIARRDAVFCEWTDDEMILGMLTRECLDSTNVRFIDVLSVCDDVTYSMESQRYLNVHPPMINAISGLREKSTRLLKREAARDVDEDYSAKP